jgi:hypothetical protein
LTREGRPRKIRGATGGPTRPAAGSGHGATGCPRRPARARRHRRPSRPAWQRARGAPLVGRRPPSTGSAGRAGCAGREGVRRPRATTDASGLTHPVSAGAPLLRSRYRSTGRVGRLGTRELRRGAWDCQRGPPCVLPSRAPSPPAHAVLARATHRRQCRLLTVLTRFEELDCGWPAVAFLAVVWSLLCVASVLPFDDTRIAAVAAGPVRALEYLRDRLAYRSPEAERGKNRLGCRLGGGEPGWCG